MASASKRPLTDAELQKLLVEDDDDFCDVDVNIDSDIGSDNEDISSHDTHSVVEEDEENDFEISDSESNSTFFLGK